MRFQFAHNNLNVLDLEKSLAFYEKALGLAETRRTVKEGIPSSFWATASRRTGWS